MIRFKSLQQRLTILLLLPVTVLLIGMGVIGFMYARNSLLVQWTEATILKLQRAAHHVDMRLTRPKELIRMYLETAGNPESIYIRDAILDQIRGLEGIARVEMDLMDQGENFPSSMGSWHNDGKRNWNGNWNMGTMMEHRRDAIATVTPPHYDPSVDDQTVSLVSGLNDPAGRTIGTLEVVIRFEYLVDAVVESGWWQNHQAYLVDSTGRILTSNRAGQHEDGSVSENHLEQATLSAIQKEPYGTVLGPGHPPDRISGFYRLQEAPWTLLIIAPGYQILKPITRFRNIYFISGAAFILVILLLIRWVTGQTVSSIREVSKAASNVARGSYEESRLDEIRSEDEAGELIRSFNRMVSKLEERDRLKSAINLAREVQQNLLPDSALQVDDLDIVGKSIYCDETGGDYYDFIRFSCSDGRRLGIAVGDVVGHGISAALLMATVRALLRSRTLQPGSISRMITDINHLLCKDTEESGNFMSLFFMSIDSAQGDIQWVRAGHDPALIYDPETDIFIDLGGEGVVLGVDECWQFREYQYSGWKKGQVAVIGTDGIWETESPQGEPFGKERMRRVIREYSSQSAGVILQAVVDTLTAFRGTARQEDDVTLVVVKGI